MQIGAALAAVAAFTFASSHTFWVLAVAGVVGVITPTGGEIGPFISIEQARNPTHAAP